MSSSFHAQSSVFFTSIFPIFLFTQETSCEIPLLSAVFQRFKLHPVLKRLVQHPADPTKGTTSSAEGLFLGSRSKSCRQSLQWYKRHKLGTTGIGCWTNTFRELVSVNSLIGRCRTRPQYPMRCNEQWWYINPWGMAICHNQSDGLEAWNLCSM